MRIRPFRPGDEHDVVALWRECGLTRPWNDPHRDIQRKLTEQPELFLVATLGDALVGSAMVGFDGHRGWVYSLAVLPSHQRGGIGAALVRRLEMALAERGCLKINLQVRTTNTGVLAFYEKLGYKVEEIISMGKRLYE